MSAIQVLCCDLCDRRDDVETLLIPAGGDVYEIEACRRHAGPYLRAIAALLPHARQAGTGPGLRVAGDQLIPLRRTRKRPPAGAAASGRRYGMVAGEQKIRAWLSGQGIEPSGTRGRCTVAEREKWLAAHPGLTLADLADWDPAE
jgi:hypothetical protein